MESRNSLMSDIMEDMEPGVLSFIRRHVRSFPRWDLLKFLYHNQGTRDTVENLARYIGRQVERVEAEVTLMTKEELLCRDEQGSDVVYALTQDPETLALIGQLVSASQDRTFRMKLVYHILRAGGNE
jgi:hypothetical protein